MQGRGSDYFYNSPFFASTETLSHPRTHDRESRRIQTLTPGHYLECSSQNFHPSITAGALERKGRVLDPANQRARSSVEAVFLAAQGGEKES